MTRKRQYYREIFFAYNGIGPYSCFFCHKNDVTFEEVIVHHIDEDVSNNDSNNLAAAHHVCHSRHHLTDPQIRGRKGGLAKAENKRRGVEQVGSSLGS